MSESLYKYDFGFWTKRKENERSQKSPFVIFFLSEDNYDVVERAFNLDSKVS